MIRVKVEMCPHGDEDLARTYELGRMYIANDGRRSVENRNLGDYTAAVCRKGSTDVPQPIDPDGLKPTRSCEIQNYPRLSYNVWRLIARAALNCFPEEASPKLLALAEDQKVTTECSDEDALELGQELLGPTERITDDGVRMVGRKAWLRGARPRGF